MCGIVGILSSELDFHEKNEILQKMNHSLIHRGPDDSGCWIGKDVGFAVRRLEIIDLSEKGSQPMHLDGAGLTIAYNGEVYNYREIKEELVAKGHTFLGNSDTEVVLHAFKEWGLDCFRKFNGMFALAIWDESTRRLFLARDRLGIKPLYYCFTGNDLFFGSEMKAMFLYPNLKKKINTLTLFHYLIYHSSPIPETIIEDIYQVKPGTVMIVDTSGIVKKHVYWNLPKLEPDESITETQALETVQSILYDAVKLRLRSDVPVGVFLSGGIDSSLITAIASSIQPGIQTFSVGYLNYPFDESPFAKKVANYLKTNHKNIIVEAKHLNIEELKNVSDEPLGSVTIVPYLNLAGLAREHVKVVLAGDGGDEFFCGYTVRHLASRVLMAWKFFPRFLWNFAVRAGATIFRKGIINRNFRLLEFCSEDELLAQIQIMMPIKLVAQLVRPTPCSILPEQYSLQGDDHRFLSLNYFTAQNYFVDTVLKTTDRVTMAKSIEGRVPYTDFRLIEYASRIPEKIQLKGGTPKYILKTLLKQYVPEELVRRSKLGFSVPIRDWLKLEWSKVLDEFLSPSRISRSGTLNESMVSSIVKKYKNGGAGYENILWNLFIFQIWWEKFIDNNSKLS